MLGISPQNSPIVKAGITKARQTAQKKEQSMDKKQIVQKILIGIAATVAGAYTIKYLKRNKLL